jgi:hypothetical protein
MTIAEDWVYQKAAAKKTNRTIGNTATSQTQISYQIVDYMIR